MLGVSYKLEVIELNGCGFADCTAARVGARIRQSPTFNDQKMPKEAANRILQEYGLRAGILDNGRFRTRCFGRTTSLPVGNNDQCCGTLDFQISQK